jgi:hypothetical protein
MKLILISLSVLLLAPNFFNVHLADKPQYDQKELFDSRLSYINSTQKLIEVADSIAAKQKISQGSLTYAVMVTKILRKRFYHGFSRYPLNENWIAALGESLCGYGLASIVEPDQILKYSFGGCSQQSIVLMEVMKRKNISYRPIGFPHHFAIELKLKDSWYFFDPNMEPNISDSDRIETRWNYSGDNLKKYYDTTRYTRLDWMFGNNLKVKVGETNAVIAPNIKMFHSATGFLSKTLWIFPLVLIFYRRKKVKYPNNLA